MTLTVIHCSFCGQHRDDVAKLVEGPGNVGICNECHETMRVLMPEPVPLTPEQQEEMNRYADEFIAASEAAQKDMKP